jgi:hypothetical protein
MAPEHRGAPSKKVAMLAGRHHSIAPGIITGAIAASVPVKMIMSSTSSNYKGGWEAISKDQRRWGAALAKKNEELRSGCLKSKGRYTAVGRLCPRWPCFDNR